MSKNLLSGELKIGASDTLCQYYLLPLLETFHKTYPEVKLRVSNRTTPETIELLKRGAVDIAFVNLPIDDEALCIKKTMRVHDVFIAGKKYDYLKEDILSLSDIAKLPLILLETASNSRRYIDEYAKARGVTLTPQIELGAHGLLVEFARINLGICCVTREFCNTALKSGDVFELKTDMPIPDRTLGMVWLCGVPLSAAALHFSNLIQIS